MQQDIIKLDNWNQNKELNNFTHNRNKTENQNTITLFSLYQQLCNWTKWRWTENWDLALDFEIDMCSLIRGLPLFFLTSSPSWWRHLHNLTSKKLNLLVRTWCFYCKEKLHVCAVYIGALWVQMNKATNTCQCVRFTLYRYCICQHLSLAASVTTLFDLCGSLSIYRYYTMAFFLKLFIHKHICLYKIYDWLILPLQ